MNFSDSEIVGSILTAHKFQIASSYSDSDIILLNTCSIRDNAEQKIRSRLQFFASQKRQNPGLIIGVLGCMAERLKTKLLEEERCVDIAVGPDAYRDLPRLLSIADNGQRAVNVLLSADETYADISPVRLGNNKVTSFITIMRGCENHCSYCVVPSVRGTERSRDPITIVNEAKSLAKEGYREVTLIGQNVNSYRWETASNILTFPDLLKNVAAIDSCLRVRFATSHPKDLSDELLAVIAQHQNICKSIHLPLQSGSSAILHKMNRGYDRQWYIERIEAIRRIIPNCSITTDIIAGFCSETEQDHLLTLSAMKQAQFDYAYMFKYSERPDTPAANRFADDVPDKVKSRRLNEIIALQQELSLQSNREDTGKTFQVLVEGFSKRSKSELMGRTSQNKVMVFKGNGIKPGDYVNVEVVSCTAATLLGVVRP